ncbi:MAG: hypothetical protein WCE38_10475 [Burkholderiales bacterium]
MLTPPGTFVLEPSLQYIRANDNRVALVGFTIVLATIHRDVLQCELRG